MNESGPINESLSSELIALRQRVSELEAAVAEHHQAQAVFEPQVAEQRAARLESETRFRQLIDESLQGILIHRDHQALFVNQAYADMFGYETPDDLYRLDTLVSLIAPPDQNRLILEHQKRLAAQEATTHVEYQGLRKDGSLLWVDMTERIVNWEGQPAAQCIVVDISERRRVETVLRGSQRFLQSTLDALSDHIAILDETGMIIRVNAAWKKFGCVPPFTHAVTHCFRDPSP